MLLGRRVTFGVVAIGDAAVAARASAAVAEDVLLACFAALMLLVGGLMAWRRLSHSDPTKPNRGERPRLET